MAALQVRNFPEELHGRLEERSKMLGLSMSEYVTRVLRTELARPTFEQWADGVRTGAPARPIDVIDALDGARAEYDPPANTP